MSVLPAFRVQPFAEKFLLNSTVLDWISPPNCEKVKIDPVKGSVIQSMVNAKANIFSAKPNTSYWHWATKPLRAPVRLAYMLLVADCIAPLGMVYHGVQATKHLGLYLWTRHDNGGIINFAKWQKTAAHVSAFFSDFKAFLLGAVITGMVAFSALILLEAVHLSPLALGLAAMEQAERINLIASAGLLLPVGYGIGAVYDRVVPMFFGGWDCLAGMTLSLSLRNDLGLVNRDGGPLPFSSYDQFDYTTQFNPHGPTIYLFKGEAYLSMSEMMIEAEFGLLELVKEANYYLKKEGLETLEFKFPFRGDVVASLIERAIRGKEAQQGVKRLQNLAQQLRLMQNRTSLMRDYYRTLCSNSTSQNLDFQESYVKEEVYRNNFMIDYTPPTSSVEISWEGINPDAFSEPADLYEQFKYRLQVNKWLSENNREPNSKYWIFGVEENCSLNDLNKRYRQLQLATHADKNVHRTDEATQLNQSLVNLYEQLKKELEKGSFSV